VQGPTSEAPRRDGDPGRLKVTTGLVDDAAAGVPPRVDAISVTGSRRKFMESDEGRTPEVVSVDAALVL
jgi:hypothetical protein